MNAALNFILGDKDQGPSSGPPRRGGSKGQGNKVLYTCIHEHSHTPCAYPLQLSQWPAPIGVPAFGAVCTPKRVHRVNELISQGS